MTYRMARLTELDSSLYSQVEGGLDQLSREELEALVPEGMELDSFAEKLREGQLWLLTENPKNPALKQAEDSDVHWALDSGTQGGLSESANQALYALTNKKAVGGFSSQQAKSKQTKIGQFPFLRPQFSHKESQLTTSVRPDFSDTVKPLKYEYNFEIACSEQTLINNVGCSFALAKTIQEPMLGSWHKSQTKHGTKFTIHTAFNEPKRLMIQVASAPMGITLPNPLALDEIGTDSVRDAYIPVVPAVESAKRLGLPTEGYYYHFCHRRLIQEYKILGDGKWSFYGTRSTHEKLDARQGFNKYQTAILLFWKLRGHVIKQQNLVYLPRQITRDELDNINEQWLEKYSVAIDMPKLLNTRHQKDWQSESNAFVDAYNEKRALTYFVQRQLGSNKREGWSEIAAKHGISAKRLLELNPRYLSNPAALRVGDEINVVDAKEYLLSTESTTLPREQPRLYQRPINARYRYPEKMLAGTHLRALNNFSVVDEELPIVNLGRLN